MTTFDLPRSHRRDWGRAAAALRDLLARRRARSLERRTHRLLADLPPRVRADIGLPPVPAPTIHSPILSLAPW